ncbi:MAG TPA: cytochrome C oxidase subunit IV family protein [Longimicrobiales bacterium]|nr:cytochrome C oxidase subunit IV family protein [Longimicrobiales bacterium]
MEHHVAVPAGAETAQPHPKPNYMGVFGILAVLTAVEVGVAFIGLSRTLTIIALLALALWKALLVALYYMHLRYEPRRLHLLVLAPMPLVVILLVAVLTEF